MKMTYRVVDEELSSTLEVTSGHMNISFEIDQTMPAGSAHSSEMTMVLKGKGAFDLKAVDLQGRAHLVSGSQDVNMKMVMPASNQGQQAVPQMFGGMKEEIKYLEEASGTVSNLLATITMNGQNASENYTVDGVAVTAQAYAGERDKFANSMMAFNKQGAEQTKNPDYQNQPLPPQPQPRPEPIPEPPGPQPLPPEPRPNPGTGKWICVVENYSNKEVFAGYGSVQFVASSKATQACKNSNSGYCSSVPTCEEQALKSDAWYCQTKNYSTDKVFGGSGASRTEAAYFAQKECFKSSGSSSSSCATVYPSDCVRQ